MARFGTIFAGPVEETMPQNHEAQVNAATKPGTIVVLNSSGKFIPHATQGVRGSFYVLAEGFLTQDKVDTDIPADQTAVAYVPLDKYRFYALVETGTNMTEGVTLLTSNGSGVLELAASGDEVMFVADETYNNNTGSNQLVTVRPFAGGSVA